MKSPPLTELLEQLREFSDNDLPVYSDCLSVAYEFVDPVFHRGQYHEFFWHCASTVPGWLPQVILANCGAESDGSRKLCSLWSAVGNNPAVRHDVYLHSQDEAIHSRLFIKLAQLAFPTLLGGPWLKHALTEVCPMPVWTTRPQGREIDEHELIDQLVQMNIGEIRTRVHVRMLAPVIVACAPEGHRHAADTILRRLLVDEVKHIGYTARLMEHWVSDGQKKYVKDLYTTRLADFNVITYQQTRDSVLAYGEGRFPELLEI